MEPRKTIAAILIHARFAHKYMGIETGSRVNVHPRLHASDKAKQ